MKSLRHHLTIVLSILLINIVKAQSNYFMVDKSPVFIPEPGYQGTPSVAFNGTNYFAVWGDNRAAYASVMIGSFVNQDGTVLNPAGKLLLTSPGNKNEPVVAFDGLNFLIVWRDDRNGQDDIYGARFNADGELIGDEFPISTVGGDEWGQEVTFDGTNYFVVWIDYRSGANIYGARVDQSGNVLDPNGIAICTEAHDQEYPRVSAGANHYLVVWEDYRNDAYGDYYGARIEFDGTVLNPDGFVIQDGTDDQVWGDVCFDGTNWLVVWCQYPDVHGKRISSAGTILDPASMLLSPASSNANYSRLKFDGANYLLSWVTDGTTDIRAARVSTSGILLDPNGIDISVNNSADEEFPSVVYGNGKFFISWMDDRNGGTGSDIYGARLNTSGSLLDVNGILLSASANQQTFPACAFDGSNYLVVWADNRNSDTLKIYAARINQAGTLLSPGVFRLSNTPAIQSFPNVTFDGLNYVVVWYDERIETDIYGIRVSPAGNILDPGGFLICGASNLQNIPAIASNGSQSFVVWVDYRNSPNEIWGARIDQSGNVLEPDGFQIYSGNNSGAGLDVTYGTDSYLLVYGRQDGSGSDPWDVYGSRVNTDGSILDPNGFIISNAASHQDGPSAAFDGTNFFVVWQDNRNHPAQDDIYGARVSTNGIVIDADGIPIATDPDYQQVPDVIFDRNQYIVVWFDKADELNLKGADIDLAGNITNTYTVSDQFGMQTYPSLAHGPEDQVLVIYQGFATDYQNTNYNALRTWGTFLGLYVDVENENSNIPDDFALYQNYPNPFNPSTKISWQSPVGSWQTLKVYDVLGNEVATLVDEEKPAGTYNVEFTIDNLQLSSGVYFYQLKAGDFIERKKMLLLK